MLKKEILNGNLINKFEGMTRFSSFPKIPSSFLNHEEY